MQKNEVIFGEMCCALVLIDVMMMGGWDDVVQKQIHRKQPRQLA
jgi:hypothetical protein